MKNCSLALRSADSDKESKSSDVGAVGNVQQKDRTLPAADTPMGILGGVVQLRHIRAAVVSGVKNKRITPSMLAFYDGFRGRG